MAKDNAPHRAWSGPALQPVALARDPFDAILVRRFGGNGRLRGERVPLSSLVSRLLSGIDSRGFLYKPGTCARRVGINICAVADSVRLDFASRGQGPASNAQAWFCHDLLAPGEGSQPT